MSSNKKILIVVTNNDKLGNTGKQTGWYLPEVAHPYEVFVNNGYTVEFASPKGRDTPMDQGSYTNYKDDKICAEFLKNEAATKALKNTLSPDKVNPKDYVAIFYAGGHGPMYDMPDCEPIAKLASQIYENKGVVGAVCHGPCGLVNIKLKNGEYLVKGKKVCSFTNNEETAMKLVEAMPFLLETKLKERGGVFVGAENWAAHVQSDQRVVTGQNPKSATPCAQAVVDELKKVHA